MQLVLTLAATLAAPTVAALRPLRLPRSTTVIEVHTYRQGPAVSEARTRTFDFGWLSIEQVRHAHSHLCPAAFTFTSAFTFTFTLTLTLTLILTLTLS